DKDVVERGVGVDGKAGVDNGFGAAAGHNGDTDARLDVLIVGIDERECGDRERQRRAPEGIGPSLLGYAAVVQQVYGLPEELVAQAQVQSNVGLNLPVILEVEREIRLAEGKGWVACGQQSLADALENTGDAIAERSRGVAERDAVGIGRVDGRSGSEIEGA